MSRYLRGEKYFTYPYPPNFFAENLQDYLTEVLHERIKQDKRLPPELHEGCYLILCELYGVSLQEGYWVGIRGRALGIGDSRPALEALLTLEWVWLRAGGELGRPVQDFYFLSVDEIWFSGFYA